MQLIEPHARGEGPAAGLAIVVNANAKRGGRRVAVQIARVLPGARVRLTKTIDEIAASLRTLATRERRSTASWPQAATARSSRS